MSARHIARVVVLIVAVVVAVGVALVLRVASSTRRYEAEIERLKEERRLEQERLTRDAEYWHAQYMKKAGGST